MSKFPHLVAAPLLLLAACATTSPEAASFGIRTVAASDNEVTVAAPATTTTRAVAVPAAAPATVMTVDEMSRMLARSAAEAEAALAAEPQAPGGPPRWRPGGMLTQGYFGVVLYEADRTGGNRPAVSTDDDVELPTFGGGAMWKLGGDRIDMGLEAMLSFGWRADAAAIAVGGGGAAVAVDVDLFVFELYGGPFASMFLGDNIRVYVSAGPLMQWATYEEESVFNDGNSSGFGFGYYARTGLEFVLGGGTMIGFGVRWGDTEVDLDNNLGDLELHGLQLAVTFSQLY